MGGGTCSGGEPVLGVLPSSRLGYIDGKPRCGSCGHTMSLGTRGFLCIENTCRVGLAVLGDYQSAEAHHKRHGAVPD